MAETGRLVWPVQRRNDFVRIIAYIVLATAFIFIIDVLTPLGVMIWILYLIPLLMTVYLSWKYAPLVMTGVFIILMAVSLFLSPRDIPVEYALLNRAFFSLILIIASLFIESYVANVEELASSEQRYRHLIEWLPEGIVVCRNNTIVYVNPAGIRMLGTRSKEELVDGDIIGKIDPAFQAIFRERLTQATIGAQVTVDTLRLIRQDGSNLSVGVSLGPLVWDRENAVQVVLKMVEPAREIGT